MSASVVTCNFSYTSGATITAKLFEVDNIDAGEVETASEVVEYLDGQGHPTGRYYATFQDVVANDYQMIIYVSNVGVKSDMFYTITDDSTHVYSWSEWKPLVQSNISSPGSGMYLVTFTIKQANGTLIADCDVNITTSSAGPNTGYIITSRSNANGVVNFYLDAGTYYGWKQKNGITFSTNPFQFSVDDTGAVEIL